MQQYNLQDHNQIHKKKVDSLYHPFAVTKNLLHSACFLMNPSLIPYYSFKRISVKRLFVQSLLGFTGFTIFKSLVCFSRITNSLCSLDEMMRDAGLLDLFFCHLLWYDYETSLPSKNIDCLNLYLTNDDLSIIFCAVYLDNISISSAVSVCYFV